MATVLLIGSTGFIGKVTLERLLNEKNVVKVYLLIRGNKGGQTASFRCEGLSNSPCFTNCIGDFNDKVIPVEGDTCKKNLGLSFDDADLLLREVTHITNLAASVTFDLTLKDATLINVESALNVLDFSKQCSKLERLVHCSTAYVFPSKEGVVYKEDLVGYFASANRAKQLHSRILNGPDLSAQEEEQYLEDAGLANTYVFSKGLAEALLSERRGAVPLFIVRPSIVGPSLLSPCPGWVDSLSAISGYTFLFGGGFLHTSILARKKLDVVPCDYVAHILLFATMKANFPLNGFQIINATAGHEHSFTSTEVGSIVTKFFKPRDRHTYLRPFFRQLEGYGSLRKTTKVVAKDQRALRCIQLMMKLSGKKSMSTKLKKMIPIIETTVIQLYPMTNGSWNFQSSYSITTFSPHFSASEYMNDNVCGGVLYHLIRRNKSLSVTEEESRRKDSGRTELEEPNTDVTESTSGQTA